jgi:hypothetical protein
MLGNEFKVELKATITYLGYVIITPWKVIYTRCAWAGGTFFPVVLLCQFLVLAGNRFWFNILMYLEYNTIVRLCYFFGSGRK